jgi:hypothetical protein
MITANTNFLLEHEWQAFWDILASEAFFKQSVEVFLDHKTCSNNRLAPGERKIFLFCLNRWRKANTLLSIWKKTDENIQAQSIRSDKRVRNLNPQGTYASIPLKAKSMARMSSAETIFPGKSYPLRGCATQSARKKARPLPCYQERG